MALQMTVPNPYGIDMLNAYIWVIEISFNSLNKTGRLVFAVHPDEASAFAEKPPIYTISLNITPDGANDTLIYDAVMAANPTVYGGLVEAVYTTALTRDEFDGATVIPVE